MAATKTKRRSPKTTPVAASPDLALEKTMAAGAVGAEQQEKLSAAHLYKCVRCGASTLRPKDKFFLSPTSVLYIANEGYVPICKTCMQELYSALLNKYSSPDTAIQVCCHYLDWPYDAAIARKARDNSTTFPLPIYYRSICSSRFAQQTFVDTLQTQAPSSTKQARAKVEQNWDRESLQNMGYIKNIVGYDPFDDESFTSTDRKFLFNTMAGYCPDSTVSSDSHKLQSILNIVKLQLQAYKVGEQINQVLAHHPIDVERMNDYTNIQKNLHQSINTMAKENGISASGNGGVKPANTLTERMKLLKEEGFEAIEVNMFNVEQSEMFQKIADISINSIIKELQFEDNDYSEILSEQLAHISTLTQEHDTAVEELRVLENKMIAREEEFKEYEKQKNKKKI